MILKLVQRLQEESYTYRLTILTITNMIEDLPGANIARGMMTSARTLFRALSFRVPQRQDEDFVRHIGRDPQPSRDQPYKIKFRLKN